MKTFKVTTKQREYRIVDVIREYEIEADSEEQAQDRATRCWNNPVREYEGDQGKDGEGEEEVTDTEDITPEASCTYCNLWFPEDEIPEHELVCEDKKDYDEHWGITE